MPGRLIHEERDEQETGIQEQQLEPRIERVARRRLTRAGAPVRFDFFAIVTAAPYRM